MVVNPDSVLFPVVNAVFIVHITTVPVVVKIKAPDIVIALRARMFVSCHDCFDSGVLYDNLALCQGILVFVSVLCLFQLLYLLFRVPHLMFGALVLEGFPVAYAPEIPSVLLTLSADLEFRT